MTNNDGAGVAAPDADEEAVADDAAELVAVTARVDESEGGEVPGADTDAIAVGELDAVTAAVDADVAVCDAAGVGSPDGDADELEAFGVAEGLTPPFAFREGDSDFDSVGGPEGDRVGERVPDSERVVVRVPDGDGDHDGVLVVLRVFVRVTL